MNAPRSTENEPTNHRRILAATSGNRRDPMLRSKEGVENQDLFAFNPHEQPTKAEIEYKFPILQDNIDDHRVALQIRLQQRRLKRETQSKRRLEEERPWLRFPKYIAYLNRLRKDTGKDGKHVWDTKLEDSFQNAIVNIGPMGKKKATQHGKQYGRNELVSEWIFQETGECRDRKQVSSHIQVLNGLLRDCTEWMALTHNSDKTLSKSNRSRHYTNSIQDQVEARRIRNSRYGSGGLVTGPIPASLTLGSNAGLSERYPLAKLSFEMWVSLPRQTDQALHNYTRLQNMASTSNALPLEAVRDWRSTFPNLGSIIDKWQACDECDIILLDVSFQLMPDFPPQHSKLGIGLELDFLDSQGNNYQAMSALRGWSCQTRIYRNGRAIKDACYDDCHVSSIGKVKPLFESKWWASTFTELTERKRMAEDQRNEAAMSAANEFARNFFRGLSVIQQISAGPFQGRSNEAWIDEPRRRKRMATLLWRFSQASTDYAGTTTWQKLVPPPSCITTNSPPPSSTEVGLPALNTDTIMEDFNDSGLFSASQGFYPESGLDSFRMDSSKLDDELCQDGYMVNKPSFELFNSEDTGFPDRKTQDYSHDGLHDVGVSSFQLHDDAIHPFVNSTQQPVTNIFELPRMMQQSDENDHMQQDMLGHGGDIFHDVDPHHQPLLHFDHNTHNVLQAQLSGDHDALESHVEPTNGRHDFDRSDEDQLHAALMAATAMSDLSNPSHHIPPITTSQSIQQQFHAPVAVRPRMQTHYNFNDALSLGPDDFEDLKHDFHHHHHHHQHHHQHSLVNLHACEANNNRHDLFLGGGNSNNKTNNNNSNNLDPDWELLHFGASDHLPRPPSQPSPLILAPDHDDLGLGLGRDGDGDDHASHHLLPIDFNAVSVGMACEAENTSKSDTLLRG